MATRTVTGNIKSLTDGAVASGTVTFQKVVTSTTGTTIHQSGVTTATTDASGDFSIALAVPASGSYRYWMTLPNGDSFYFSIDSGTSINVATLIVAETITSSDAVVEALEAYLPLAGGTMTGQLNFSGTTHAGVKLLSLTTTQRDALTAANGMVIYNSTTATGQVYQGGAWVSVGTTWGSITGTLSAQTDLQTALDAKLDDTDVGVSVQAYSAKTAAIAALTWVANSMILLTGAATASVQALAAHVITFLQSASAADARTAIGAGTGDVTAAATFATDNRALRSDGTGKGAQSSGVTIDDSGDLYATLALGVNSTQVVGYAANQLRLGNGAGWFQIAFYTDSAQKMILDISGWLGIGAATPQGKFHVFDTDMGWLWVRKVAIDGTSQEILPDAAGDVIYGLAGTCLIRDSTGVLTVKNIAPAVAPGATFDLINDGTNILRITVAAGGQVTVARAGGSRTFNVTFQLMWQ